MENCFAKNINFCLNEFSSSLAGLSKDEALLREKKFECERIKPAKHDNFFIKFIKQFSDLMIIILLLAASVSFVIGIISSSTNELFDALIIMAIVLMNAIFGVVQENKAEKSIEALKNMTKPEARVIRDGEQLTLPADRLVPGDLIILDAGSIVPADCRLVETASLQLLFAEEVKELSRLLAKAVKLGKLQLLLLQLKKK